MAALIAIGVVGGVQAVRAGFRAHQDHKHGLAPMDEVDASGRVVKPHPVYRWVSKLEAKRKAKGEGSSSGSAQAHAQGVRDVQREVDNRGVREKEAQAYTRPADVGDAPPSYEDAVPGYAPPPGLPPSGAGGISDTLPDFPSAPTHHPSAENEKVLLALRDLGVAGELEGLVDLMRLGETAPEIDVENLNEGDIPSTDLSSLRAEERLPHDVEGLPIEEVITLRKQTARRAAEVARQINNILRDLHTNTQAQASPVHTQIDALHVTLRISVETLEDRLNRLIVYDARLAELHESPAIPQSERQRTPLLA